MPYPVKGTFNSHRNDGNTHLRELQQVKVCLLSPLSEPKLLGAEQVVPLEATVDSNTLLGTNSKTTVVIFYLIFPTLHVQRDHIACHPSV